MIRPAWGASVALHAGVMALLYLLAWASPSVQPPLNWEVKLAVEPALAPSPAPAAPAAAIAPPPETPAVPPSVITDPVTPPKPTPKPASRQVVEAPPPPRRSKAPAPPPVHAEPPRRVVKQDTPVPIAAKPASPEQSRGEEAAIAGHPGPVVSLSQPAEAIPKSAGKPAATSGLGQGTGARELWYAALITKLREMRHYPPAARRLGQEGIVLLAIEIGAKGELRSATLRRSSGFALLDQAATHLIQEAVSALDGRLSPPSESRLEIPVAYRLDN